MTRSVEVPALASDARRNAVALALAAAVTVIVFAAYIAIWPVRFTVNTVTLVAFVFWVAYALGYLVLTQRVFGGADAARLRRRLTATSRPSRALPPSAVQWSLLALAAVTLVLVLPDLLSSPLANALGFAVVVSAWLVTVTGYAVHYARLDTAEHAIAFPGPRGEGPVFADYYYLSGQVSTTFSSSDVNMLTTRARAVVTGQTFIAFVFSTFIIAMLITVLFMGTGPGGGEALGAVARWRGERSMG